MPKEWIKMEKKITVFWPLTPIQLKLKLLQQWTQPEKNYTIFIDKIQIQQCRYCILNQKRILKIHKDPGKESDTIEFDRL